MPASAQSGDSSIVRASAAYAELKVRRTELEADIEAFSADYTEQSPRIMDLKAELAALDAGATRLMRTKPSEAARLTIALGKLLVRHASLSLEVSKLLRTYATDHPEVLRAKRRAEVYDRAIKELLP
jgi:uncharacterized protein involved in exopolysaccharide biosynthesis